MPRLLTVTHPWSWVVHVIRSAIKGKTQVVTTSYVSPAIKELNGAAKEAGITVLNEVGVDPGVDHLYAIKVIREVHEKGGKVIDGYSFLAYPNRNSVPFREFYQIPEAQTIIRGSLRYDGNPQLVKALIDIGWLDVEAKDWLSPGITWAQIQQRTTSASSSSERDLLETITSTMELLGDPSGYSAMSKHPAIAKPGVVAPYTSEMCDALREKVEAEGIKLVERVISRERPSLLSQASAERRPK
ncbi:hypothetical protein DL766_004616 [Monosporascus sp. MC13-8B]|nr:hypothetical protein DL766_004616 [Monosporascus sp. MC13-8B]